YFGVINSILEQTELPGKEDILADLALELDRIIEADRIVDWVNNVDIQNKMKIDMEDCIYEYMQANSFKLGFEAIDDILEKCIDIAQHRRP
ncbi:MAG TPA: hypothetical protein P5533_03970, partial [Candidatus Cloacimonadota bacterium]|nr:hypothetical protein [Candidatus Cloacimonadota bacterium]